MCYCFVVYTRRADGISEIRSMFIGYMPRCINMQICRKAEFRRFKNQVIWLNFHGSVRPAVAECLCNPALDAPSECFSSLAWSLFAALKFNTWIEIVTGGVGKGAYLIFDKSFLRLFCCIFLRLKLKSISQTSSAPSFHANPVLNTAGGAFCPGRDWHPAMPTKI